MRAEPCGDGLCCTAEPEQSQSQTLSIVSISQLPRFSPTSWRGRKLCHSHAPAEGTLEEGQWRHRNASPCCSAALQARTATSVGIAGGYGACLTL